VPANSDQGERLNGPRAQQGVGTLDLLGEGSGLLPVRQGPLVLAGQVPGHGPSLRGQTAQSRRRVPGIHLARACSPTLKAASMLPPTTSVSASSRSKCAISKFDTPIDDTRPPAKRRSNARQVSTY
jgi:hypothetical protein